MTKVPQDNFVAWECCSKISCHLTILKIYDVKKLKSLQT